MSESDQVVIDGITVDLVDPALCTPMPTSSDVLHRPDSVAHAGTVLAPSGELLTAVQSLLPGRLSDTGLIDALEACDRLRALVDAKQAELLAELASRDPHGEKFLRDEAALALKLAPATARDRLAVAEARPAGCGTRSSCCAMGTCPTCMPGSWPTPPTTSPTRL